MKILVVDDEELLVKGIRFNLQNDGVKSYAMWQYEKGADTLAFFLDH